MPQPDQSLKPTCVPMPKFHCTHCEQHIDAPEEMAGTHANCPTCGEEIQIPGAASILPLTSASDKNGIESPAKLAESGKGLPTKPSRRKSRWWRYFKYSLISFGMLLFGAFGGPFQTAGPADSMASYTMSRAFSIALSVFVVTAFWSIIAAVIGATLASAAFKKSFSTWASGIYLTLMLGMSALVCFADLSGINEHGRDKTQVKGMMIDQSGHLWITMNLFRINLDLPKTPKVTRVSAPIETREFIKGGSYDQAMIKDADYEVAIMRIERKAKVIDLEEIRSGSINDIKNSGVASGVQAKTGETQITGHDALWSELLYTVNGREWCTRSLVFANGGTLWIIGVTGDSSKTIGLWNKIMSSVSIGSR